MAQLSLFDDAPQPAAPPTPTQRPAPPRRRRERTAIELKREGMDRATWGKEEQLGYARELAFDIARGIVAKHDGVRRADGLCHADDVAAAWARENAERAAHKLEPMPWLGNAAGSIFKLAHVWEATNLPPFISRRPEGHGNKLTVWRLRHPNP